MASWFIPCSPSIYDAEAAFSKYGHIVWHQQCNMAPGDIAYIYVSEPVKEIRCRCIVEGVDIPYDIGEDEGYILDDSFSLRSYHRFMDLKLVKLYDNPLLGYQYLKQNGLRSPIRSQRHVPEQVEKYIEVVAKNWMGLSQHG